MYAINGVNFGFSVQLGNVNNENMENLDTVEAPASQEANSFLSVLNMLDTNADGKIDTDELKFGAGFMINTMIYAQDRDGNLLLNSEEAGVSPGTISLLDTDSDKQVSAGEMITAADKIIDGLVPALDTDGDGALSREELAVLELLFTGHSTQVYNREKDAEPTQEANNAGQPTVSETENTSEQSKTVNLRA
jgi:hypothetical protein